MVYYFISFMIGFFFGIIPFSYIIARIKGVDLKNVGSGNIGATNLGRSLGLTFFVLGFILDSLKGLVPVLLVQSISLSGALAGAGAIFGHIFNPFFQFRGGKGVSTTIGVAIGLAPLSFGIALIVWIIIYFSTFFVSLASISLAVILPLAMLILQEAEFLDRILIIIIALFVIYAHRTNINRLLKKSEPKTIFWRKK
jgi:glycerol-3-phosphate acyltransferase PlsY